MIRILLNIIKYITIFAILITLLLFFAFVINNWGDDELKPEVVKALAWTTPENTFKDNGYLILLGMEAPVDMDAASVGKQLLAAELARFKVMQATHKDQPLVKFAAVDKYKDWKDKRCDYTKQKNCVDFYSQISADQLIDVINSQDRLIKRFEAIKQSANYVEAIPPTYTSLVPSYQTLVLASELARIQALLDIFEGRLALGIDRLTKNSLFSRQLLRESNSLISHMIALSMMQRDTRILSELLMKYPALAKPYQGALAVMTEPISISDYSLVKPLTHERALVLQTFDNLKYVPRSELIGVEYNKLLQSLAWLGFQANATMNVAYQNSTSQIDLAMVAADYLDVLKVKHKETVKDHFEIDYTLFTKRNPVGRILNNIAQPDFSAYIERQHDLTGYLIIVNAQLQMLADKMPAKNTVLTFHDPYTRAVMPYDQSAGILTFEGRQPSNSNFNKSSQYQIKLP
jgi:hypothetical protein